MAARAGGPSASPAGIDSLDDGLLARILGCLTLRQRCASAAGVARRWRQCCSSPALVHDVLFTLDQREAEAEAEGMRRLRSWCAWMLRHARSVRFLDLSISQAVDPEEAMQLVASAVSACAACGDLASLDLNCDWGAAYAPLVVSAWGPALTSLRRLSLQAPSGALELRCSLASLAQLDELALRGQRIVVADDVRLPLSLRRLWLGETGPLIPPQVHGLSRLTALGMLSSTAGPDGYAALTSLTALRRLDLVNFRSLPTCLPELTSVESLAMCKVSAVRGDDGVLQEDAAAAATLEAALQRLTRLTALFLCDAPPAAPPAALTSLPRLQHFSWGPSVEVDRYHGPLLAGPWQHSLRALGANFSTLLQSSEFLSRVARLEHLLVYGSASAPEGGQAAQEGAFWAWLRRHPSLRRVSFSCMAGQSVPSSAMLAALALKAERPELVVDGYTDRLAVYNQYFMYSSD